MLLYFTSFASCVTDSAVFELLRDQDPNKACGPDLIPARLLKEGAEEISHSLSRIFQLSLCSGTLPQDWISAHIVPVHKKNDKSNPSNYRPISLTSVVVKTLEKLQCTGLLCLLWRGRGC